MAILIVNVGQNGGYGSSLGVYGEQTTLNSPKYRHPTPKSIQRILEVNICPR